MSSVLKTMEIDMERKYTHVHVVVNHLKPYKSQKIYEITVLTSLLLSGNDCRDDYL